MTASAPEPAPRTPDYLAAARTSYDLASFQRVWAKAALNGHLTDELKARLAPIGQVFADREPGPVPAEARTEWCVFAGGPDPDNAAHVRLCDDEEEAREEAGWMRGARVASRVVHVGDWDLR